MQNHKFFALLGTAVLFTVGAAHSQQVQVAPGNGVKIKNVETQAQKTPNFQAGDVKNKNVPNPREWLEVEVEFEVDKVQPRDAVVPSLLFKYYIAIRDEEGNPVCLTGDVEYINVISGDETYSAVYVNPSTLGKITGEHRRLDTGKMLGVGVEIFYNGVLVGGYTSGGGKFWETLNRQPGVLSREKTPFSLLWIDRYPEVKGN